MYRNYQAFGRRIAWRDDDVMSPGHSMTFKDALHIVSTDCVLKALLPEWSFYLTKRLRKINLAFDELEVRYHAGVF